jgi:hypothetical protein
MDGGVATGKRPTKEYLARVAAERKVLRAGDTKTIWRKYLRYLYAELLKAYFGHKCDPDVRERFADLFLSTMEAYFAREDRPLTLTLTFLLTANYTPLDWLKFFALEAGRPDLLFGLDRLTAVLKKTKTPIL